MKRLLPAPLLSAGLLAMWLMLNRSAEIGHVLLGGALAVAVPLLAASLRPLAACMRRPGVALRLFLTVGRDVVVSNLQVAWGVLHAGRRKPNGVFVKVPLELRDPNALAALAVIATVVPGTVWSELALDRTSVLMHVFDLDDEAIFIEHYKARYERPLKEIFE